MMPGRQTFCAFCATAHTSDRTTIRGVERDDLGSDACRTPVSKPDKVGSHTIAAPTRMSSSTISLLSVPGAEKTARLEVRSISRHARRFVLSFPRGVKKYHQTHARGTARARRRQCLSDAFFKYCGYRDCGRQSSAYLTYDVPQEQGSVYL